MTGAAEGWVEIEMMRHSDWWKKWKEICRSKELEKEGNRRRRGGAPLGLLLGIVEGDALGLNEGSSIGMV
jgi:hypothetical protein